MKYPIYEQCERSISNAIGVLESLHQRQAVNTAAVQAIHTRRHTADIALQGTFEELRHAFVTPIDRENLLRLRQVTEAVTRRAEDIVLELYYQRKPTASPNDNAFLCALKTECTLLMAVVEAFPTYPRSEDVLKRLAQSEQQHRRNAQLDGSDLLRPLLKNVSTACAQAVDTIRYILLKIT